MGISENIAKLLRDRDEKGLEMLYDNYSKALYTIAFRILDHQGYAEEALQTSFLKVWRNIDQYDPTKATLYTWMAQIVRYSALDIRRLKSFERQEKTESFEARVHSSKTVSINTSSLDAEKVLSELDEKYRLILDYIYLRGYTHQELSDELGIPLGTIKTRLRKAISIIRNNLEGETKLFLGILLLLAIIFIINHMVL